MEFKIFDTLLEPIFVINSDKKIIYCNEPAALICDSSVRKLCRNQPALDQVVLFDSPLDGLATLSQISDPTPYQEVGFKTESGKTGKVQITLQAVPASEAPATWLVFFRDVTLEETLQKKYRAELSQKEDVIEDLKKAQAELQNYSKNLEKMVDERTFEIRKLNQTMAALLDSLGQGFFIFNKDGDCLEIFSKACVHTVQCEPKGKKVWDVLHLSEHQVPGFQKWMLTVFSEMLPFEDLAPLGPQSFAHTENRDIQLEYYPLRGDEGGPIEGVVVVATDITSLVQARREAEVERSHAKMIISLINQKKEVIQFLREAEALVTDIQTQLSQKPFDADALFRTYHTLKGGAASFSIKGLAEACHHCETLLTNWRREGKSEIFQDLIGYSQKVEAEYRQFLSENNSILGAADKWQERWIETPISVALKFESQYLSQLPEVREGFYNTFLMEKIGDQFRQYKEIAQTVAEKEGKLLKPLEFKNGDLKILPDPYAQLFSTFIHAYRNAVDHGIETPDTRLNSGKPQEGQIITEFQLHQDNGRDWLTIVVADDGGGIAAEKIRDKLTTNGKDVSKESDSEVIQHIFDSQFSTKEVVTETSGRGVGMDAILTAAKNLGGHAWVESTITKGTRLFVKVPYLRTIPSTGQRVSKTAA